MHSGSLGMFGQTDYVSCFKMVNSLERVRTQRVEAVNKGGIEIQVSLESAMQAIVLTSLQKVQIGYRHVLSLFLNIWLLVPKKEFEKTSELLNPYFKAVVKLTRPNRKEGETHCHGWHGSKITYTCRVDIKLLKISLAATDNSAKMKWKLLGTRLWHSISLTFSCSWHWSVMKTH